jgi:hypothetical protein
VLAQKIHVRFTPIGDDVIIVTIGDLAADHQQQHLTRRMQKAVDVAGVLDVGEMLQQDGQAAAQARW